MESKWHDGVCGPCALCTKSSQKYTHIGTVEIELKQFYLGQQQVRTAEHTCLCYACLKYAKRIIDKENFLPRWINKEVSIEKCCIQGCKKAWRSNSILGVTCLEEILEEKVVAMGVDEDTVKIGLCKDRYNKMYAAVHKTDKCANCGSSIKERNMVR